MNEAKKGSPKKEQRETVDDFVDRVINVFRRELRRLVPDTELEARIAEFKSKIIVWPKKHYLAEAKYIQGFTDAQALSVPAFVASHCAEGGEANLGSIFINIDCLTGFDSRELLAILCHEGLHKLGPRDSVLTFNPPESFSFKGKRMLAFLKIENNMGPLSWTTLAYLPKEDNWGMYRFLDTERNFEKGEFLLWETITDWFSNQLFLKLNSNYKQKSGYLRGLINQLVYKANNKGIRLENAIKLALIKGDKAFFIKLLENTFGQNAYQDLIKMFKALDKAYPVYLAGNTNEFSRFYDAFIKKFKERFV